MQEIWRDVKDYEGLYQISSFGKVKSLDRIDSHGQHRDEKILKQRLRKDGYLQIDLCKNGKSKTAKVQRLVGQAFLPNPNNYPEINYLDEDKTNNHVDNLEWCDSKYNCNYGTRNNRIAKSQSQPVIAISLVPGKKIKFSSASEAAKELSLWNQSISRVLNGKQKTAGGYTFEYANN